jgi:hypothetical protein
MATKPAIKRADIRAFIGATGSGKGIGIREHLKRDKPTRLMIFDPMHEYGDLAKPVQTIGQVIKAMQGQKWAVAWQQADGTDYESKPFKAQFDLFCRAAFMAGNCWILVEELELVTRPSWAPPAWRNCTKRGRHEGLTVIGASQRPADCDKAFLSSCTYVRCHALREHGDRLRMAQAMDVPLTQVEALKTVAKTATKTEITYFERDYNSGESGQKTLVLSR